MMEGLMMSGHHCVYCGDPIPNEDLTFDSLQDAQCYPCSRPVEDNDEKDPS